MTGRVRIHQGDMLLLCSDGLSGKLRAEDIQRIITDSMGNLDAACDALIAEANQRGGEDNITVVLARFTGDELSVPDSRRITVEMPTLEGVPTLRLDEEDTTEEP